MMAAESLSTTSRTSNMMPDVTNVLSPCYNSSSLWLFRTTRSARSQSLCYAGCTSNCNLVSRKRRDHPQVRGVVVNGGQDGRCFHVGTGTPIIRCCELRIRSRTSEAFETRRAGTSAQFSNDLSASLNPHVFMNNMHAVV